MPEAGPETMPAAAAAQSSADVARADAGEWRAVIAVVGRPNAGKSTLVNHMVGQKITITSRRPQTTRHPIRAIHTQDRYQLVFIDTPGINQHIGSAFLRQMNKTARSALTDAELVLLMLDGLHWGADERAVLQRIPPQTPCIAVVNKIDRYRRDRALGFMRELEAYHPFREIVPMSARKAKDIAYLEKLLRRYATRRAFMFPPEQITDRDMRFYVSELIREKILRRFHREVPYSATVAIDDYHESTAAVRVKATIHVERESHKHIIVGERGAGVCEIGKQARADLEKQTGRHVDLRLWVKVSRAWSTEPRLLRAFGYPPTATR